MPELWRLPDNGPWRIWFMLLMWKVCVFVVRIVSLSCWYVFTRVCWCVFARACYCAAFCCCVFRACVLVVAFSCVKTYTYKNHLFRKEDTRIRKEAKIYSRNLKRKTLRLINQAICDRMKLDSDENLKYVQQWANLYKNRPPPVRNNLPSLPLSNHHPPFPNMSSMASSLDSLSISSPAPKKHA